MQQFHCQQLSLCPKISTHFFMPPLSFENTEIAFEYKSDKDLKRAHFLFSSMSSPFLTKAGMTLTQWIINLRLPLKGIIKRTIFDQFCGGETIGEVADTAKVLAKYSVGVALDYGVEGSESETKFDAAVPEFVRAVQYAATQENIPFIPLKITGFSRFGLLERIHDSKTLSPDESREWGRVQERINTICKTAADSGIMILIDAEQSWIQQPVDDLANRMMENYNRKRITVFNTFQLYRHDRYEYLQQSLHTAQQQGYILGAKLVRGAYMEKERARAAAHGYPSPIQPDKESCDRDYDLAVALCLNHLDHLAVFIGTHNEGSCMKASRLMQEMKIPNSHAHVFISQLYGMSDNVTFNLAHEGFHASKYLPYGPVQDVLPYLMRRAQENTSVAGQTGRELSLIKKEMIRRKLK